MLLDSSERSEKRLIFFIEVHRFKDHYILLNAIQFYIILLS